MTIGPGKKLYDKIDTYQEDPSDSRPKILVVDDEKLLCWSICKNLTRNNEYTAACLETGNEALQFVQKFHFDLLILDHRLPDMTGLEVLSRLKEQEINIPVIMITASNDVYLETKAIESGARLFLRKPFKLNELYDHTKKLLQRPNTGFKKGKDLGGFL